MQKGLIGKKIGMTQIFADDYLVPVTIIQAGPCFIIQKKFFEKDGYKAIQIGYNEYSSLKKVNKALQGHFRRSNKGIFRIIREIKLDLNDQNKYELGQKLTVEIFKNFSYVNITGISKGKGFAGVIKRHKFKGGRKSHGSMFHRAPGSIGASADPSRVFKGKKLPGHMGNKQVTLKNLKIIGIRPELNILLIKGAVPGSNNGILFIKESFKKK